MTRSGPTFELTVLVHDDVLVRERLTRSLHTDLDATEGIDVQFSESTTAAPALSKAGGGLWDAALWVFLGSATGATARVVIEAVKAWSAKERNRKVRISDGDRVVEISGSMDETQERIVTKFLENGQP
nr:hypothetical protein [Kibdelosporangium sp. MJ126-NF4]CTQ91428.1 hypothetical protein [Kibdelosporangium sp. MJ126-NF4]